VSYDPGAKCPKFQEFLDRVQPDKDAQAYLQRLMGYSLTGYTNEAIMVFHYGEGANGKSVFHDLMNRVFGDYAQTIPVETLIASRSKQGKVPNDVARMKGRRYLAASEAQEGTKLDAAMIKSLTGGEKIVARFMRAEFFEFYLIGTIHLTANHLQHLPNDPATHRRLNLCRWDVKIPEQERNLDLADQIFAEEAAGILNWVLQGVAEWRRQKLNPPQKILGWTRAYIEDENVVHRWMEDRCDVDRDATKARPGTLLQELFDDIGEWGRKTKTTPAIAMSRKVLAAELRKDDFLDKHGNKGIFFPQVCLKLPDVMR
jgi:putative DNA primase/helicase